jgi:hypothetical protein
MLREKKFIQFQEKYLTRDNIQVRQATSKAINISGPTLNAEWHPFPPTRTTPWNKVY